jgi:hypothetical protein
MVGKIEYAGANHPSFEQAARSLEHLAELSISGMHVQRVTERLGRQRQAERDRQVEQFKAGQLQPTHRQPPAVAAVHLDAGKVQMRQQDAGRGVHQPHWSDDKVACLVTYPANATAGHDPHPEPPAAFLERPTVLRLCQEISRVRNDPSTTPTAQRPGQTSAGKGGEADGPPRGGPKPLLRTAVATMQSAEPFGWMVAAEAKARGFYEAPVRGLLGDGGNWISPLGQMHFDGWVQVLDFVHLIGHLFSAATAAYRTQANPAWKLYVRWVRLAWAGAIKQLRASMNDQLLRLGPSPPQASPDDPRRTLAQEIGYVGENSGRMDYPAYRRAGLPVSSAAVESLIKQFNQRVKGTEKFWARGGAEAILQSRAAFLSDDGRAEDFYARRPRGPAVGQNRRKLVA